MRNQAYRININTSAVVTVAGKQKLVTIPAGSIVIVEDNPSQDTGLVAVKWEDRVLKIFARDLSTRGAALDDNSAHA